MSRRSVALLLAALALTLVLAPRAASATDSDGPDCGAVVHDFGDAPEGIPILGDAGPAGRFPTCVGAQPVGTQTFVCAPRGSAPGPTGFVHHVQSAAAYWLTRQFPPPLEPWSAGGVDSEVDGKVSASGPTSVCNPVLATDCTNEFGMGQDECEGDDDAGVTPPVLLLCFPHNQVPVSIWVCSGPRTIYLNVLADLNGDGDWNDNVPCQGGPVAACSVVPCGAPDGCAHEWAVKNHRLDLAAGAHHVLSPPFEGGTGIPAGVEGRVWMRVTLTDEPVDDDFPWAGSANRPGGAFAGGETEDHLALLTTPDPVRTSSWGSVKLRYR